MSLELKKQLQYSKIFSSLNGELSEIDTRIASLAQNNDKQKTQINNLHRKRNTPILRRIPINSNQLNYTSERINNHRLMKSLDPTSIKEKEFLEKYFNLNLSQNSRSSISNNLRKSKLALSKPRFIKINPKIIPRATRLDPITYPMKITEDDMQKGIYSLVNLGAVPKNSDLFSVLNEKNPPLVHQPALLHDWSIQFDTSMSIKNLRSKDSLSINSPKILGSIESIPMSVDIPKQLKKHNIILYITNGVIVQDDNYRSLLEFENNSYILKNLKRIETLTREYSIKKAKVNIKKLVELSKNAFNQDQLLQAIENSAEIKKKIADIDEEISLKILKNKSALKIQCN